MTVDGEEVLLSSGEVVGMVSSSAMVKTATLGPALGLNVHKRGERRDLCCWWLIGGGGAPARKKRDAGEGELASVGVGTARTQWRQGGAGTGSAWSRLVKAGGTVKET
jgi:hypothetical protein